ncbi:MAG: enhanced intracellular survival protein Eis [Bacillota bacterium]
MDEFRKLGKDEMVSFARIAANAYPGFKISSDEDIQKYAARLEQRAEIDPRVGYYGLYREGTLTGGLCMWDCFKMNLLGVPVKAGGVGNLAVDLTRKKEKVARDMMLHSLRHFREKGAPIVTLYPFRPDFYRKMGFGYGTRIHRYTLNPADLSRGRTKEHIVYLTREDAYGMHECYMRFFSRTHGMMSKAQPEIAVMFDNAPLRVVGCKRDGKVTAYMAFTFRPDTQGRFLVNDILVRELVFDDREDLSEMMAFLHSQADQVRKVIIDTQDDHFFFLPVDPRDGSLDMIPSVYHVTGTQGVGLMYKVVDVPGVFGLLKDRSFGGMTLKVRLTIEDSFQPENSGSIVVHFTEGLPEVADQSAPWDVEITMDVAEFSSMLVGAVGFESLHNYGLADISDVSQIPVVDALFKAPKPICLTAF